MGPTFDMNLTALLRSPLLSRTNIDIQQNHSTSSTSPSSSETPRTPTEEALGVSNHGKELDDVRCYVRFQTCSEDSGIKIRRGLMLASIARGSVRPQGEVEGDETGRPVIRSATTTVVVNQSAPFLPNRGAIIPAYVNNSTIRLRQFIALVIFTASIAQTLCRYWVGGLKNPAVFRSIVYLLRMFPSKMPINSIETMKHAFAGLGTLNFAAVLERLALQVVDYDLLVRNGDWENCSVRLREYMRVLTSKESRDAVEGWLDVMEVCPAPRTALKRSGCIANMDKARILLKALATPEMAASSMAMKDRRMTAAKRQAVEKRLLEWVKGVDGVQIPHSSGTYNGPSKTQSVWVPPSAVALTRAYAYPYATREETVVAGRVAGQCPRRLLVVVENRIFSEIMAVQVKAASPRIRCRSSSLVPDF
ncbi:hypothetical protein CPB85DRAFT_1460298 [Mucidula mucida]|nr:hypothetical protein CPB85DRAFT_1460298 [Mucidula mucida]